MTVYTDFLFEGYDYHRDLHVMTHSFPPRRSSDLRPIRPATTAMRGYRAACGPVYAPALCADAPPAASIPPTRASRSSGRNGRSEEHTSELQSLMRISYAVFCLKKKKQ